MLSRILSTLFIYLFFLVCVAAQVHESGSVTALTQCTCQTSAATLYFSPWLFTLLSPADISDETVLFCAASTPTLIHSHLCYLHQQSASVEQCVADELRYCSPVA